MAGSGEAKSNRGYFSGLRGNIQDPSQRGPAIRPMVLDSDRCDWVAQVAIQNYWHKASGNAV